MARRNPFVKARVVGSTESCADQLRALAAHYRPDEIIFGDVCPRLEGRVGCYQLLASALI